MTSAALVPVPTLQELETVIDRGIRSFVAVGQALEVIRRDKLYKDTHSNFDVYCKERWGFSRQRSTQVIAAAEVATIVAIPNEAQARELVPLKDDPPAMAAAVKEAEAETDGKLTAKAVRSAVQKRSPKLSPKPIPINRNVPGAPLHRLDQMGIMHQFYRAIHTFADMPPAAEVVEAVTDAQRPNLDEIDRAIDWAIEFRARWKEQK